MTADITVVIPTLGRPILEQALDALVQGTVLPAEVIVVDQSQSPAIERLVRDATDRGLAARWIPSDTRGRSAGVNRGIAAVQTRFVAITDDDCLADRHWIERLSAALSEDPSAIVTGRVAGSDASVVIQVRRRRASVQRRRSLGFDRLSGGNMAMAAGVVARIGGLDEDPAVRTAEDHEFAYRALRAGIAIRYLPDVVVTHLGWRDEVVRTTQYASYARSHGGFYGKYLRRGDAFMAIRAGLHWLRATRRWLVALVRGDRERALLSRAYVTGLPAGVRAGWRSGVTRDRSSRQAILRAAPDMSTTPRPIVAVVMLTLNQRATTLRALESIGASRSAKVKVLLWDNGSDDDTATAVREAFPDVLVHHHSENLGVAGGRNAGAALAIERFAPDYLCFLDNDLVLTPGFIDELLSVLQHRPDAGQAQAKLRYLDRPDILNDGGGCRITFWNGRTRPIGEGETDRGQYDRVVECVSGGGAMMVRTSLFQALRGFDLAFNPFGPEDLDFSLRLRRHGYKAYFVPAAMAYHAVSHTFESGGYSARYARLKAKHWLTFLRRHAPWHQRLVFFIVGIPFIALKLLVREGRRGNLGAVIGSVRGTISSLRGR